MQVSLNQQGLITAVSDRVFSWIFFSLLRQTHSVLFFERVPSQICKLRNDRAMELFIDICLKCSSASGAFFGPAHALLPQLHEERISTHGEGSCSLTQQVAEGSYTHSALSPGTRNCGHDASFEQRREGTGPRNLFAKDTS